MNLSFARAIASKTERADYGSGALLLAPPRIAWKIEVCVELLPIDGAMRQDAGGDEMDDQCSVSTHAMIEGFQMPHGSESHFQYSTMAATELMHLQHFRELL